MQGQVSPGFSLLRRAAGLVLLAATLPLRSAGGSPPQITAPPSASQGGYTRPQSGVEPPLPADPLTGHSAMRLEHMREEERRKRLQADAAKLVELSNALKTAVDNTTRDELSIDVVRRAAEIEKTARDLKERMKS